MAETWLTIGASLDNMPAVLLESYQTSALSQARMVPVRPTWLPRMRPVASSPTLTRRPSMLLRRRTVTPGGSEAVHLCWLA